MSEDDDIQIPEILPVMTLQDTVLFPHVVMPLFIFEQRYRLMLAEVLQSHRLFAVFNEKAEGNGGGLEEAPEAMGTVGVVRAAHQNPDGTSNLALQGLLRVRLLDIVQENPFRLIRAEPCPNTGGDQLPGDLRLPILSLLDRQPLLARGLPEEYLGFLRSLDKPAPFIDVAIHSLCQDAAVKQRLLETLSLPDRYTLFGRFLAGELARLDLFQRLQGGTRDEEIELN